MNFDFDGQTALVTGASQGIGRAIARILAAQGVKVAVAARRVALLEVLREEIQGAGHPAPAILEADLYPEGAAEKLADEATRALGRIDILVNSAGGSRPIPFDATKAQWMEGLTLNFLRLRELTHALVPGMRERRWGRIVNLTGTSEPRVLNAAFSAKAAVHAWSKGLSREIAKDGVTINCIQPGRIRSEQIKKRYPTLEDELAFAREEIPAGRFGEPEELAHLAVFLASPLASYITGTVIPVDGGMYRFAF
ncbi:MAG: SDR family oxidoreductase [Rhodospirillaceae bacterium]